ncbi:putative porin [Tichowtungia aerotolerans]|uniref:Porin n=1 Tax=Tichowtungia aerotolerans TaxID=2697043 RepID=A0A6P1MBE5_9BACT|nr:putative porin [Tichowtungia aerotolerans]QHI70423.1 hypothetical protein GT409_13575 [Tichowtungia aerotolerans]
MKRIWITGAAVALTVSAVWAEDPTLAELQAQLKELSAKIEKLERQQASPAAPAPSADLTARIEKLENGPKIPEWVTNTKIKGDLRYRYENTEVDGSNSADRQRARARIGAYGSVNDYIDYGIRFATGKDSATSANETLGDEFLKDDAYFDLYYVDIHPEQFKGAHVILGKMKKPWLKGSGLIWDGDTNPEGIAVKYDKKFEDTTLFASAGSFVVSDNKGDDAQLWSGQAAVEQSIDSIKFLGGASLYHVQNGDVSGLSAGQNLTAQFNIVEGFGSISAKPCGLPVKVHGQYAVNTEAVANDDTAYLVGVVLGKAKAPGSWEIGYNWRDTGRDAVIDAFNDSDFAGGDTGSYGHQVKAKYQISENFQAAGTYFNTVNGDGADEDMVQLDLNFNF